MSVCTLILLVGCVTSIPSTLVIITYVFVLVVISFTGYTRTTVMNDEHATTETRTPPGDLALVEAFLNTTSFERDEDELAEPADMTAFLHEHELADPGETFDADGVARLLELREALRALLLSHHGEEVDRGAVASLEAAAAGAPLIVAFAPDGETRLEPALGGVEGVLGRLLAIVARAEADGTWHRMKACPADDCRWAFYDHSRNRSRTWCDMAVCGNRAKARTYRTRAARRGDA
jgi:predicted RNA-binding Zn ribbon-like protein